MIFGLPKLRCLLLDAASSRAEPAPASADNAQAILSFTGDDRRSFQLTLADDQYYPVCRIMTWDTCPMTPRIMLPNFDYGGFVFDVYNKMPDVMLADSRVKADNLLDSAIDKVGRIIVKHGLEHFCGINLLHKHWSVEPGEIPRQVRRAHEADHELVTTPSAEFSADVAPSSWMLHVHDGAASFIPFEYSCDTEVQKFARKLVGNRGFFGEVGRTLISANLYRTFGICVLPREALCSDPSATPVEISSVKGRVSVIRPKILNDDEMRLFIQTSWSFSAAADKEKPSATPTPKPPPMPKCNIHGVCEMDDPPSGPPHHRHSHEHDPD